MGVRLWSGSSCCRIALNHHFQSKLNHMHRITPKLIVFNKSTRYFRFNIHTLWFYMKLYIFPCVVIAVMMMGIMRLLIRWAVPPNEMKLYRIKFMTILWTVVEWLSSLLWVESVTVGQSKFLSERMLTPDRLGNFLKVYGVLHASNFPRHERRVCVEPLGDVCTIQCVPHIMCGSTRSLPDLAAFFISPLELLDSPSDWLTDWLNACRVLTQLALRGPKLQQKLTEKCSKCSYAIASARGLCKYLRVKTNCKWNCLTTGLE